VRRAALGLVGALAAAPAVLFFAFPTFPQYDSYFHLVWGRMVLHGAKPDFEAYAAPTEHPLYVAIGGLLSLLGTDAGERAMVALTLLSLSALVVATWRVGERLFGLWPGAVAAAFVGTSFAFLLYAVRAYVDVPFLALVAWAAVLAISERRVAVMALLALAGLLRPEAWVLAGLWWLWTVRAGPRVTLTLLAASAPVLWAVVDGVVTGDPLHSLHATSSLAENLGRTRGLRHVPGSLVSFLSEVARPPVALLGVAGVVLALRRWPWRRLAVPLALLACGLVTFVGTGIAGLSILPRYLTVPVVSLCLFGGYALAGFTTLEPGHPWRRRWRDAAVAATALGLVFVAIKAPSFNKLRDELSFVHHAHDDLVAMLQTRAVRAGARCGPITYPNYRLVPDTRWLLDLPARRVGARSAKRHPYGVEMFVLGVKALKRYGFAAGASTLTNVPDPDYVLAAHNRTFAAYVRCPAR
jgi:hypothetical protein